MWVYFEVFNLTPLTNLSVSMPIPYSFYYDCSVVQLEVRDGDASRSSFIVQDCFSYPVFVFYLFVCFFPYKVDSFSFMVCKKCIGILMGITLNLFQVL